jgi:hypothetical protein
MRWLPAFSLAVVVALSASATNAGVIISAQDFDVPGDGGSISGITFTPTNFIHGEGGGNNLGLSLTFTKLKAPVFLVFDEVGRRAASLHEYLATISVTNLASSKFAGIVVKVLPKPPGFPRPNVSHLVDFDDIDGVDPLPRSPFPTTNFGGAVTWNTPQELEFDNGATLPFGGSGVMNFSFDIADMPAAGQRYAFSLSFTANPEPAAISLAGMAFGAALFGARWRRKKAAALAAA